MMERRVHRASDRSDKPGRSGAAPKKHVVVRCIASRPMTYQENEPGSEHCNHRRRTDDSALSQCIEIEAVSVGVEEIARRVLRLPRLAAPGLDLIGVDAVVIIDTDAK